MNPEENNPEVTTEPTPEPQETFTLTNVMELLVQISDNLQALLSQPEPQAKPDPEPEPEPDDTDDDTVTDDEVAAAASILGV